jgi:hypothetical protein
MDRREYMESDRPIAIYNNHKFSISSVVYNGLPGKRWSKIVRNRFTNKAHIVGHA